MFRSGSGISGFEFTRTQTRHGVQHPHVPLKAIMGCGRNPVDCWLVLVLRGATRSGRQRNALLDQSETVLESSVVRGRSISWFVQPALAVLLVVRLVIRFDAAGRCRNGRANRKLDRAGSSLAKFKQSCRSVPAG